MLYAAISPQLCLPIERCCAHLRTRHSQRKLIDYLNLQHANRIGQDLMLINVLFSSTHPISQLLHTQSRFILFGVKQLPEHIMLSSKPKNCSYQLDRTEKTIKQHLAFEIFFLDRQAKNKLFSGFGLISTPITYLKRKTGQISWIMFF